MGTIKTSEDEMMRDHVISELFNFRNPELINNNSPFIYFVGITSKESVFIDHDIRNIHWEKMRKALIYYFAPEGFQFRYIDDHYHVYGEYRDGACRLMIKFGERLEIRLYDGEQYVWSFFSSIENFGDDFRRVWKEFRLHKNG